MKSLKQISACVLIGAGLFGTPAMAAECIAPANPGGGWDFTCRSIGKIMFDIGSLTWQVAVVDWRIRM